jgi:hypothetical protein
MGLIYGFEANIIMNLVNMFSVLLVILVNTITKMGT